MAKQQRWAESLAEGFSVDAISDAARIFRRVRDKLVEHLAPGSHLSALGGLRPLALAEIKALPVGSSPRRSVGRIGKVHPEHDSDSGTTCESVLLENVPNDASPRANFRALIG
jgi:hypothetical protein